MPVFEKSIVEQMNKELTEDEKIESLKNIIKSDKSEDEKIEDMKNIYATLKPLISMGKGLIL